jgi:AAA15 family ATPase/GTPase
VTNTDQIVLDVLMQFLREMDTDRETKLLYFKQYAGRVISRMAAEELDYYLRRIT